MELNQIKLYGKVIDLEVGDLFWQNTPNGIFHYQPKSENINKIPRGSDHWNRNSYISCQKYEKEIRLADNLEKIENKPGHFLREWVVKYVYKQDRVEYDDLLLMEIRPTHFKVTEVKIERITNKLIFVTPHLPITYLSKIEKKDLLIPLFHYDNMFGICMADDYDKLEKILFDAFACHLQTELSKLQDTLLQYKEKSKYFQELRLVNGHQLTKPKRTKWKLK